MSKIIQFGIKVNGLDQTVGNLAELNRLVKDSRQALENVDPDDGIAGRKALERYAAAKEAQKQFNALVRLTQMELASAGDEATGSYRQMQNQLSILKNEYKLLSVEQRKAGAGDQIKKRVAELSLELKQIDGELGDYFRNVGNYQNAIQDAVAGIDFGGIIQGDVRSLASIPEAIGPIREQLAAVRAGTVNWAAAASLVGPAFAITAVLAGLTAFIGLANEAAAKTDGIRRQLSRFNDLEGDGLKSATADVLALVEVTGESEQAILRAANSISKQFNVPISDAVKSLSDLWLATGDNFGEALDQAREYPVFFKDINLSVDQFNGLIAQGIQDGVFSDKGIDAIKEAVISIREMTPAAADAIAALGIDQATLNRVRSEQGIAGILDLIIQKMQELPVESQVVGQVLADVFRGAGEDSGAEFIRTVDLANSSLRNYIDASNDTVQSDEKKLKASQEYSEQLVILADNTRELRVFFVDLANDIALLFIKFINIASDDIQEFTDFIKNILSLFQSSGDSTDKFAANMKVVGKAIDLLISPYRQLINLITAANDLFDQFGRKSGATPRGITGPVSFPGVTSRSSDIPALLRPLPANQSTGSSQSTETDRPEADANAAADAARRAAEERRRAEDALTGIRGIDRDIRRATANLASNLLTESGAAIVRANVAGLQELRAIMVTEGQRLIEDTQRYLPDIDAELSGLFTSLREPDADYETILGQIVDANAERATILQRLTAAQEGLATVEQLQGLESSLARFRPRQSNLIDALPARPAQAVQQGEGSAPELISQQATEEAAARASEFTAARQAENEALAESYRAVGEALSESLEEAFADGTINGEEFARSLTRNLIRSIARVIRARAFEAFSLVMSTDFTPAAAARAGIRFATITALATAAEALANQFGEGGEIHGPSHKRGGVMINAEGGEGVLKKSAMASSRKFTLEGTPRQIADYLNRSYGGRPMSPTSARRMELGGMVGAVYSSPRVALSQAISQVGQSLTDAQLNAIAQAVAQGAEMGSQRGSAMGSQQGLIQAELKKQQRQSFQF